MKIELELHECGKEYPSKSCGSLYFNKDGNMIPNVAWVEFKDIEKGYWFYWDELEKAIKEAENPKVETCRERLAREHPGKVCAGVLAFGGCAECFWKGK